MMVFETIVRVMMGIVGFALIFFVPGYLIINKFYKKVKGLERIGFVVGISIAIAIILGLILGLLGVFRVWSCFVAYAVIIICIPLIRGRRR